MQLSQRRILVIVSFIFLSLFLSIPSVYSKDSRRIKKHPKNNKRSNSVTIKFGRIGESEIDYRQIGRSGTPSSLTITPNYSFGIAFDNKLYKKFYYSIAIDITIIQQELFLGKSINDEYSEKKSLLDVSMGLKYNINTSNGLFSFRPGYFVGYGFLKKIGIMDDSYHITQKLQFETRFKIGYKSYLIFELASYSTSGDDKTYDIWGGPALMYRIGLAF